MPETGSLVIAFTGQADTQGLSGPGCQQVQQPVTRLAIIRMRGLDQRNGVPQRPPVPRHNRFRKLLGAVIGHLFEPGTVAVSNLIQLLCSIVSHKDERLMVTQKPSDLMIYVAF